MEEPPDIILFFQTAYCTHFQHVPKGKQAGNHQMKTKSILRKIYDPNLGSVETASGRMTLWNVFLPMFLELFLVNLMGTVNTFILSYYSDDAVAAVGSAGQFVSMVNTFYTVISSGCSIVMSQEIGAGRKKAASESAFCALVCMAGISVLCSILLSANARAMMTMLNIRGEVLDEAAAYYRITISFSFVYGLNSILYAIFKSNGYPKYSVFANLCMNGINAALNYIVVFHPEHAVAQGVRGIAWSYCIAMLCAHLVAQFLLHRARLSLRLTGHSLRSLRKILVILKIGVPGGISSLSYSVSQLVTTAIIATIGVKAISTKIYVSNIVFYVYCVGLSLGLASSLLTSWLCGAGKYEQAYRLNLQNLKVTVALNAVLSLLFFLFGSPLLRIFTDDPEILRTGRVLLGLDIFVELFRAFNHIEANSLQGAGDVVFPMRIAIFSCWSISILLSWLFGIQMHLGLAGCWIAFALDEMFRGLNYLHRWRSRKWQGMTVRE